MLNVHHYSDALAYTPKVVDRNSYCVICVHIHLTAKLTMLHYLAQPTSCVASVLQWVLFGWRLSFSRLVSSCLSSEYM